MVTFTAAPATFDADKMDAGLTAPEVLTFLIYDDSAALTTWTAAATDAAKTAVGSYSDGYAIQMKGVTATTDFDAANDKIGGCIGGKKDTTEFASCAVATATDASGNGTLDTFDWSYSTGALAQQAAAATYTVNNTMFTAATVTSNDYLGWDKTWKCSRAVDGTNQTFTCNRFQVTEANSKAGDLRLDSTTTGGVLTQVKAQGTMTNKAVATWKSAATLTLSAAAAVVAAAAF